MAGDELDRTPAEIVEACVREVYGRVPADLPPVRWRVVACDLEVVGFGQSVVARCATGHVDGRGSRPDVDMPMLVVLPAGVPGPVTVPMMFGRDVNRLLPIGAAEIDPIDAALKATLMDFWKGHAR